MFVVKTNIFAEVFVMRCQNIQQVFKYASYLILLIGSKLVSSQQQFNVDEDKYQSFSPVVNHRCDRGQMIINVLTAKPFYGIIHPKDYRTEPCITQGRGSYMTTLVIELLTDKNSPKYCGIQSRKNSVADGTIALVVRVHANLELSEDKNFLLTCGKAGFRNARNETSRVTLNFYQTGKLVQELIYNQQYELKASISKPDNIHKLKVKSCTSFTGNSSEVQLIDLDGCPLLPFISSFHYDEEGHSANATLSSTFKFPESNKINVQCEIVLCRGHCQGGSCNQRQGGNLPHSFSNIYNGSEEGQSLLTSVSAFVLYPDDPLFLSSHQDCTEWRFPWLIGLCICLAILLLVMLIVNVFLCSSLTCTCTKTEVIDKEPSEMDDYDPYRVGWTNGSHYGSRTSLHKPGYNSGGSTLNSTARSLSNASDHYAIVHSQPGSHYSHQENHRKSPVSVLSSGHEHYGGRI